MLRGMSRMRSLPLRALLVALTVSACSKSTPKETVPAASPGGSDTIAVPGGKPPSMGAKGAPEGAPPTPAAGGDLFKLKPEEGKLAVTAPTDAKAGQEATAKILVTPQPGYHVNTEYPIKLTLTPPAGVAIAKPVLTAGGHDKAKGDADALDEQQLALSVKLTPAASGDYTVNGTFSFAVCDKDQCLQKKETIAIQVAAK
jgi:hypothetical protein